MDVTTRGASVLRYHHCHPSIQTLHRSLTRLVVRIAAEAHDTVHDHGNRLCTVGAVLGAWLMSLVSTQSSFVMAWITCVSAGVLLYATFVDMLADHPHDAVRESSNHDDEYYHDRRLRAFLFILSASAMNVLAVWILQCHVRVRRSAEQGVRMLERGRETRDVTPHEQVLLV